ncbi:hypothetical protein ACFLSA_03015 [Bacteroidota bacterium]
MKPHRKFIKGLKALTAGIMVPWNSVSGNSNQRDKPGKLLPMRKLGMTGEMEW